MTFVDRLKELMDERGINRSELSRESGVPYTTIVAIFETGGDNTKLSTLKKLSSYFGVALDDLLNWDDQIPEHFNGDLAAYLKFKEAEKRDALSESKHPYYALTDKDERDIARDLERMISGMDSQHAMAMYGEEVELDEEERELLRASMEQTLRLAKQLAKKKFTPKKYRNE